MAAPLPQKLVDLLREMRASGISLGGLREATGLAQDTLVRYTSPVAPPQKWTPEAEALLRELYPQGMSTQLIADRLNEMRGRSDISAHAVLVRVGQLKIIRNPGTQAKAEAIREYWRKWREAKKST